MPKGRNVPALAARDRRSASCRARSGLLSRSNALGASFVPARGGPGPLVFELSFEARFPGGVAYAMGNYGAIQRIVLYAGTWKALALALGIVLLAVAYTAWRPVATFGPPARDFEAYWAAGAAYNAGLDPYSRAIWQFERTVPEVDASRDELLPFIGPPYTLPLWSLFARLPFLPAAVAWRSLLALAAVAAVLGSASLARLPLAPVPLTGVVLLALAFGPLTSAFALGQVALLAFGGIVGALVALRARSGIWAAAGALVAALQPNLAIVLFARLRERRSFVACAGAVAGCVALGVLALGGPGTLAYLGRLSEHGGSERFVAIQLTPVAIAYGFTGARDAAALAGAIVFAVAAGATLAIAWRLRDGVAAVALACCATPFVMPFFHEHDLVVMLLPAIVCGPGRAAPGLRSRRRRRYRERRLDRPRAAPDRVRADARDGAGRWRSRSGSSASAGGRSRLAGLLVPLGVAVLGMLAAGHAAPVWPDAAPAGSQAPAGLSAAGVWALEQRAAGLERADPLWALLRLASLAGCALLGRSLAAQAVRSPGVPAFRPNPPPRASRSAPATSASIRLGRDCAGGRLARLAGSPCSPSGARLRRSCRCRG